MSKEYYNKCKSKRVAGCTNRKRNDSYWNKMNCNEKTDKDLIDNLEQNRKSKKCSGNVHELKKKKKNNDYTYDNEIVFSKKRNIDTCSKFYQ